MFVKWQNHVYDFEIMVWNHVFDSGKSNAPQISNSFVGHVYTCSKFGKSLVKCILAVLKITILNSEVLIST